jgi:triosephosphate isomerase (TIM)
MKPFFYVANWKMAMNLHGVQAFIDAVRHDQTLVEPSASTIILCPAFTQISLVAAALKDTAIECGGQTCSPYASGAYTGQVSAGMLAESGCAYCIIGHSERRALAETDTDIAAQYDQLVNKKMTPIICVGETANEREAQKTTAVLEQQLLPLVAAYKNNPADRLLIAYEPVWAIGSGTTPTPQELADVFAWLKGFVAKNLDASRTFLLYGGSVDEQNAAAIKGVPGISGLLIGGASLEFKKFKNLVV